MAHLYKAFLYIKLCNSSNTQPQGSQIFHFSHNIVKKFEHQSDAIPLRLTKEVCFIPKIINFYKRFKVKNAIRKSRHSDRNLIRCVAAAANDFQQHLT